MCISLWDALRRVSFTWPPRQTTCEWTPWRQPGGCTGRRPDSHGLEEGLSEPQHQQNYPELWGETRPTSPVTNLMHSARLVPVQLSVDHLCKLKWNYGHGLILFHSCSILNIIHIYFLIETSCWSFNNGLRFDTNTRAHGANDLCIYMNI